VYAQVVFAAPGLRSLSGIGMIALIAKLICMHLLPNLHVKHLLLCPKMP